MAKITRSVQYRYLDRERAGIEKGTLEDLLRAALAEKRDSDVIGEKARARIADLEQSGQLTLWNGLQGYDPKGVLSGELVLYKQGFDVPAIEERLDNDENRFQLVRFQTDGKSKPIEGALYFAVIGDHLGIIQSNAVTGRWLERYFTWLLKDITSGLEAENFIALNAKTAFAASDLAKVGPAKGLTVHANSNPVPERATSDTLPPSRDFKTKRKGKGATVIEVLKLMGLGEDTIESIRADVPPGGSLEGDFLVFIKQGKRKRPISLGTLDHAFRNTTPGEIDIQGKGTAVRDNLQSRSEPVRVTEGPLGLDPNEAIEKIIEVLYRWGEQGVVNLSPRE
ncbi:hypothetical protein [Novosphingobium sp. MD-1]|uniref:hypothetical protein n=1 Tax=Novosphingobium sp. MD-1 TaxID=1630648 RepID=UPI000F7F299F|nr:hypothetical protein [Novosphingobium sp. MD-1]